MRESVSREELHRVFAEELLRSAPPGSVFVFEIDRRAADAGGCNWYPLASIGAWRGDVVENLAAFRRVREALSARYDLEEPADVGTAGVAGTAAAGTGGR